MELEKKSHFLVAIWKDRKHADFNLNLFNVKMAINCIKMTCFWMEFMLRKNDFENSLSGNIFVASC